MVTRYRTRNSESQRVFRAIAAPARRRLLEALARGPRAAGVLAGRFPQARPGVARHLRVLREAGLVSVRRVGRERHYALTPAPLADVDRWLEPYRRFWSLRLDELADYLEKGTRRRDR